jgi:rhodanese-related sulfurtransferase
VRGKILGLPEATRIYPAHDYRGHAVSTVSEERRFNPRLGDAKSLEDFLAIMGSLRLAYPKRIDEAVPANLCSGVTEPEPTRRVERVPGDWAPLEETTGGVPVVGGAWLAAHPGAARLVDVREPVEFCGPLGHLEGAELVPMAKLASGAADWAREAPIVTVCTYGTRSGRAALWLREQGFERVASLHGGLVRWTQEGRPTVEVMADRARQDASVWQAAGI